MPLTPKYSFPYPAPTDAADVPYWNQQLAESVEAEVAQRRYKSLMANATFSVPTTAYTTHSSGWVDVAGTPTDAESGITYSAGTLTVSKAGHYRARYQATWTTNTTGVRIIRLNKNTTGSGAGELLSVVAAPPPGNYYFTQIVEWDGHLAAGDKVIPMAYQASGAALDIATVIGTNALFSLTYLGL